MSVGLSKEHLRTLENARKAASEHPKNGTAKTIELTKDLDCHAPFDVLHKKMQLTIDEWEKAFPLPPEYYFGGALAAFSVLIGNSIKIEYKPGWAEPASLYMALVGPASIGKTPALQKVLTPITKREILFNDQYRDDLKEYKNLKKDAKDKEDPPDIPLQRQITVRDFTTEVIAPLLIANPNGLIAIADELIGMIKNFGRYSNGSDLEFWLSVWANQTAKINRVTRGTVFVPQAFVTIIGGIQNKIVNELAAGTNVDNGFTARILFVLPAQYKTPELTDYEANKDVIDQYHDAAKHLFGKIESNFLDLTRKDNYVIGAKVNPGKMTMNPDARELYKQYFNETSQKMDRASTEWERSALGKLRSYCLRFALILRVMDAAFDREEIEKVNGDEVPLINLSVDLDTLKRAIRVCDYFESTMTTIVERVTGRKEENIIKDLPEASRELYKSLPGEFTTKTGKEIAKKQKMAIRTFERFLNREDLFTCLERGKYKKNIIVAEAAEAAEDDITT